MGYYKKLAIEMRIAADQGFAAATGIEQIAAALGGEIISNYIVTTGPDGEPVTVYPRRGRLPFIYGAENVRRVKAWMQRRLESAHIVLADAADPRDREKRLEAAKRLWSRAAPATGTLAEAYLRSRSITVALPTTLRFLKTAEHKPSETHWPTLLALVTDQNDLAVAVHRTYLARNGSAKAPVNPAKMSLGPVAGGAVRLAPFDPARELLVGEGIETSLSAVTAMPGAQAWSAISATNLRQLRLPRDARDIVLLIDADDEGERAGLFAAGRWKREGRRVRLARPPEGFGDFNDMLTGRRKAVNR